MKRTFYSAVVAILTALFVAGDNDSLVAQDKYALTAPNGISFSEIRGYETWQVIAPSYRTDNKELRVILGNPVMINAYKKGIPGNGKPFPEGSIIVKIGWSERAKPGLSSGLRTGCSQKGRVYHEGFKAISRHQRLGICAVRLRCKDLHVHALWKGRLLCSGVPPVSYHREGEGLHIYRVSPEIKPGPRGVQNVLG